MSPVKTAASSERTVGKSFIYLFFPVTLRPAALSLDPPQIHSHSLLILAYNVPYCYPTAILLPNTHHPALSARSLSRRRQRLDDFPVFLPCLH